MGGDGNDLLSGNGGNDYLMGGAGDDTYHFAAGDGFDTINNHSDHAGDMDRLQFESITKENLWFTRSGDHLLIDVIGSNDRVLVQDWYAGGSQQLDEIHTADAVLHANAVDSLVNAMAGFEAPPAGNAQLPQQTRDEINPIIASSWQAA